MIPNKPTNPGEPPAIWWIRRDVRLVENPALMAALAASNRVIPVFILDPVLINSPYASKQRFRFLTGGLHALDSQLRRYDSSLLVLQGEPLQALSGLIAETGANAIFAERDHSPYARRRDQHLSLRLPMHLISSPAIISPGEILKEDGTPYTVFTPFLKVWKSRLGDLSASSSAEPPAFDHRLSTPRGLTGVKLPDLSAFSVNRQFLPGEIEAKRRLRAFTQGYDAPLYGYAQNRNRPDLNATSFLSPYLRFGMLSARRALVAALSALEQAAHPEDANSAETWLNELAWRDFYIHILHHFPRVLTGNFRPLNIRWRNDPEEFETWSQGRTGYPLVDAAMRQLINTGWMHNRARMLVASFLTKDLLIDWRWGERWFMQHLLDGDPAANNGGWQWTAGTGTDAAPYFRIFNPIIQSARFDPQGDFIRCWLPELERVPTKFIHAPWEMPPDVQVHSACRIGIDYPVPIIDHAWARQRALAAYPKSERG